MTVIYGNFGAFSGEALTDRTFADEAFTDRIFARNVLDGRQHGTVHGNFNLTDMQRALRLGLAQQGITPELVGAPRVVLLPTTVMASIRRELQAHASSNRLIPSAAAERHVLDALDSTPDNMNVAVSYCPSPIKDGRALVGCIVGSHAFNAEITRVRSQVLRPHSLPDPFPHPNFLELARVHPEEREQAERVMFRSIPPPESASAKLILGDSVFLGPTG